MTTIELEGAVLSYRDEGSADPAGAAPLAFVHGWCSHLGHWDEIARRFIGERRIIRWDRRGMGASTTADPAPSQSRHADDLLAILDQLGVDRTVLIAHAGGGPTALDFASRYPDRTEQLIVVDIAPHDPTAPSAARYEQRIAELIEVLSGDDGDRAMFDTYASFFGPLTPPDVVDEACRRAVATDRAVAIAELRHVVTDTATAARAVTAPVLWISARPDDSPQPLALFSDVMVGHVVGSGHFPQVEVPDQVEAMMRTFLASSAA